jgi:hypothetical protein
LGFGFGRGGRRFDDWNGTGVLEAYFDLIPIPMYMPTLKGDTRPRTIGEIPFIRHRFTVLPRDTTEFDPFCVDLAVDEGWGCVVCDGDEGAVVKVEGFAAAGVDAESGLGGAEEGA